MYFRTRVQLPAPPPFSRGFAPRTPLHALSLAASPAHSDRVARSLRSLAIAGASPQEEEPSLPAAPRFLYGFSRRPAAGWPHRARPGSGACTAASSRDPDGRRVPGSPSPVRRTWPGANRTCGAGCELPLSRLPVWRNAASGPGSFSASAASPSSSQSTLGPRRCLPLFSAPASRVVSRR